MPISRKLKIKIDYSKLSHNNFALFVEGIYSCLLNNLHFPDPTVALAILRAKLDEYQALITAAMDRSRNAILKRNSVREELAKMVMQLGHYVERVANGDSAIIATSGFPTIPTDRLPPQHLETPQILKTAHHVHSGAVKLTLTPSRRKIKMYQIRIAEKDSPIPESECRIEVFTSANGPVTIDGLKPATTYIFQVRAQGVLGFTDWSNPVSFICT